MISAITVPTPELGDRSYVVHDGSVGAVIDPQRDTDRLVSALGAAGVHIACVAETHVHNDYVSGGWALAQALGVPYLVAAGEEVSFDRLAVHDGDEIPLAPGFSLRVVATPGHTPHHVAYLALDQGRPVLALTGGSLLFGSVGRTDLLGAELAEPLAHQQYRSVHDLARLPGAVKVLPTHGFGSFCAVGEAAVEASTIEDQRVVNPAFVAASEDSFVAALLRDLVDYPRYYHRMGERNRQGAPAPDLSPPPRLEGGQIRRMAATDAWVVDLRERRAFAAGHLEGTINLPQEAPFTTYLGWLLPNGAPLVLMAETAHAVAAAQVNLARIGIEGLAGQHVGPLPTVAPREAVPSYPVRSFADLGPAIRVAGNVALDVRRREEWDKGHLDGALHMPLHEIEERIDSLPPGTLWVHCAAGYRATIAASLLARHGREVVLIGDGFTAEEP
jgi:hydroxyacylglutathione hydrolase